MHERSLEVFAEAAVGCGRPTLPAEAVTADTCSSASRKYITKAIAAQRLLSSIGGRRAATLHPGPAWLPDSPLMQSPIFGVGSA